MQHEPIASIDLMERAATRCVEWIQAREWHQRRFHIFCGKGNNGGDGLAIARQLVILGYQVDVHILEYGKPGSADFQANLQRLHDLSFTAITFIQAADHFPELTPERIIIDALYGTGLNKPLEGHGAALVQHINVCGATVVSIDLPSGMMADDSSRGQVAIQAAYTLSFQVRKLAFLMQENAPLLGEVSILDIGLHPDFLTSVAGNTFLTDEAFVKKLYRPRNRFAHKGHFGHALVAGGSFGKMGAAVLATKACIMAGAGLTTALVPPAGYQIMQVSVPEAMVVCSDMGGDDAAMDFLPDHIEKYTAIGMGPGMGSQPSLLHFVLRRYPGPVVMDADAINMLAADESLLEQVPKHSIITPHPKEFERLFGKQANDFVRMNIAIEKAAALGIIIVLKGHHTLIALPEGQVYFNTTGNAGLAKGGSGDVLTGVITGLLAQGYTPAGAAILGVYLHGLAADLATKTIAEESLTATDTINHLSKAFLRLGDLYAS